LKEELGQLNIPYITIHFYYNYIIIKILRKIKKLLWKKEKNSLEHNKISIENEKKSKNKDRSIIWKIFVIWDSYIQMLYMKLFWFNKIKIYDRYFLDYKISWDFLWVTYNKNIFNILSWDNKNYFILTADAQTLYKRKPEHTQEFFNETVEAYNKLSKEFKLELIDTKKMNPQEVKKYILETIT
jgi:hypothetical protein